MMWNSIHSLFSAKLDYHWPADNVLVLLRVESPHSAPFVWNMKSVKVSVAMSVYYVHGFVITSGKITKW